jgi:acetoacetate decarboxylase
VRTEDTLGHHVRQAPGGRAGDDRPHAGDVPRVDGRPAVAQQVGVDVVDVVLEGAWAGGGRLDLVPSVNAPLADLPVRAMAGGLHLVTDLTLPHGTVLHDDLG